MAFIPINLSGQFGLIRDIPPHLLQPNAWTGAQNARMADASAGTIAGYVERYATPPIAPHSLVYVPGESNLFWLLMGLDHVYAHNGSVYSEITRPLAVTFTGGTTEPTEGDIITGAVSAASGTFISATITSGDWSTNDAAGTLFLHTVSGAFNSSENLDNTTTAATTIAVTDGDPVGGIYTGLAKDKWNGGVLSGIAVLNNGVNVPQYWATAQDGVRLANLPNWPANTIARVVRPFKNFLVALDVTVDGVRRPYLVKWSHSADAGAVPTSWDAADASKDAGKFDLGQTKDALIDSLPLGADLNIIYKEQTTWGMQFIGHPFIFRFFSIFETSGIFNQSCVVEFKAGMHAVLTRGDFIVHNGRTYDSMIAGRNRDWLFNSIDADNWQFVFVAHNPIFNEVWICFPSVGASFCDSALIWNYRENAWYPRDLPAVTDMALGIIETASDDTWNGGEALTWDEEGELTWGAASTDPTRRRALMASPSNIKVYEVDVGNKEDGVSMVSFLEREGLSVEQIRRDGSITENTESWKLLRGVRPRFRVPPVSATISVWVGTQENVNVGTIWHGPYLTDASVEYKVDVNVSGRLIGVRFDSTTPFQLDGYDLDIVPMGLY